MLRAVVLAQGDELTTGATVDTNSNWLANRLWSRGVVVRRIIAAPDDLDDLVEIVRQAAALAPLVLSTGGLGPTRDDLTAEAVARAFDRPLEENPIAREQIIARYALFQRVPSEEAFKQGWLPRGAEVLENLWGTAPGFAVTVGESTLYFMPGVPREARPMYDHHIAPVVAARAGEGPILHVVRTAGVPESELARMLRGVAAPGLTIGYRTSPEENQVKLRFEPGTSEEVRATALAEVRARLGRAIFNVDGGDLAEELGQQLAARGHTLALAESCTAGRIASWVASVPGASRYLLEGAVVYSNEAKVRTAGVSQATLDAHGAVSEPVARQLAEGIRARAGATWGVGVTGIAGPGGGSEEKPVGTVHIAAAGPAGTAHRALRLYGDRSRIVAQSAANALHLLIRQVVGPGD